MGMFFILLHILMCAIPRGRADGSFLNKRESD